MQILVTGGSGFIGSNLCKRLIDNGDKVICVDNNYTGKIDNIKDLLEHSNFKFIEHDICDALEINEKLDQIYNLACPASPPAYQGKYAIKTTKTCVIGILNMLELAKKHNAIILQASTSEVYGDPLMHPQNENYRGNVNPIGIRACYDEGKRCAESLMFDYHRHENVGIKVIRIFNTYGPNMDPNDGRVVSNFICQALSGKDITIYGNGSQTRSFCYIDDLIDIIIKVMNSDKSFTGPINTGNSGEFTIKELAQKILDKIQTKSKIIYKDLPLDDPTQRHPDISLAKSKFNWEPKIKLDEGLDKTIDYFKKCINEFKG
ncbi:UDP-glucuronic acid decarboxylase family protein [Campylobacter insulaenigrae]|uniref:UDP-glucuronic acid decarboxylase family protein n=1 Tax=Campylobacter insulaenigrae TaxID=260714 RepID=UPI0021534DB6|nr:UDP-glucuronic acid decarboxylase family protein [Campylobacter insulaenigrae]MCR6577143.1 SDR family oxidoreductase [Campylobacter insulaenigrae]